MPYSFQWLRFHWVAISYLFQKCGSLNYERLITRRRKNKKCTLQNIRNFLQRTLWKIQHSMEPQKRIRYGGNPKKGHNIHHRESSKHPKSTPVTTSVALGLSIPCNIPTLIQSSRGHLIGLIFFFTLTYFNTLYIFLWIIHTKMFPNLWCLV